jgi:DNA-binding NarL/FixJ family response regulator
LELTELEIGIVRLLACGASDADIATDLSTTVRTASWHVGNIISKLHASNRTQAAFIALWRGFIPLDQLPVIAAYVPPLVREEA